MHNQYINTDILIDTKHEVSSLVSILDEKSDLLYNEMVDGVSNICFEAEGSGWVGKKSHNLHTDIEKLLTLLEELHPKFESLFSTSLKFEFNIGIASNNEKCSFSLPNNYVKRISSLGASIAFTITEIVEK